MSKELVEKLRSIRVGREPQYMRECRAFLSPMTHAAADRIEQLEAALDQLLDDMGEHGLCVCQQAKEEARAALEWKDG